MISSNEIKYYSSLRIKKFRDSENKFIVEGDKIVSEGLNSDYKCEILFMTKGFENSKKDFLTSIKDRNIRLEVLKNKEFNRLTSTITPQGIAAVFSKKRSKKNIEKTINGKLVVYLDEISDPGNLGTIIRNCDWFGIKELLISKSSADYLNPKSVRASMGSLFHINIFDNIISSELFPKIKLAGYKILSSDLNGINIFEYKLEQKSIIIFSNESAGPSNELKNFIDNKITIPRFGGAESLNVASASAVILGQLTMTGL